jgi:hypothetical protein
MPPRRRAGSEDVQDGPSSPKKLRVVEPPTMAPPVAEYVVDTDETDKVLRVMGISSFSSSKGKDHSASDCYGFMKMQTRKTRQMVKTAKGR